MITSARAMLLMPEAYAYHLRIVIHAMNGCCFVYKVQQRCVVHCSYFFPTAQSELGVSMRITPDSELPVLQVVFASPPVVPYSS